MGSTLSKASDFKTFCLKEEKRSAHLTFNFIMLVMLCRSVILVNFSSSLQRMALLCFAVMSDVLATARYLCSNSASAYVLILPFSKRLRGGFFSDRCYLLAFEAGCDVRLASLREKPQTYPPFAMLPDP